MAAAKAVLEVPDKGIAFLSFADILEWCVWPPGCRSMEEKKKSLPVKIRHDSSKCQLEAQPVRKLAACLSLKTHF